MVRGGQEMKRHANLHRVPGPKRCAKRNLPRLLLGGHSRQTAFMDKFEPLRKLVGPAAKDWQDADFEEADENLRHYVAIALRIFERLELDEKERDRVASLTTSRTEGRINAKGRENNQK